ncbi:MAG: exopolyphosphatase, partial [Mucilaginibacter polytrichastri]|nr:exopolyphosphatase [Mucilaginibacter polytrichastri]
MKAVLDLGTNTFHLLIGDVIDGQPHFEVREFRAVKLGEGGINKKTITKEAWARAMKTLREYRSIIDLYPVDETVALATSAVRNAENGQQFCAEVLRETGISITTIDGETEAGYIFSGIALSGCMEESVGLIVDIGGGSVEFIIGTAGKMHYKRSI